MTKRESTYRFVRQSGGIGQYAQITLTVEEMLSTGLIVQILPTAFAWLKDVYGPDAWEWPVCDEYRRSALFGVAYALQHAEFPSDIACVTISVVTIHASPADTSGNAVAYATAFALSCGKPAAWSRAYSHAWKEGASYFLRTTDRVRGCKHAGAARIAAVAPKLHSMQENESLCV